LKISISKQDREDLILILVFNSGPERITGHLNLGTLKVKNQGKNKQENVRNPTQLFKSPGKKREECFT
jgi:hypothetical protein